MPPSIPVELLPHDPAWMGVAEAETLRLAQALGPVLRGVHHVGSTAIPGIHAKPIIDLMPVVEDLEALDGRRSVLERLGYAWWGELGLPGRRYCTWDDPTGRRRFQLHAYAQGSSEISRHLAFRDHLRRHPEVAADYDREKARCQRLHPDDSHAYSDCKSDWIRRVETQALAELAAMRAVL